VRLRRALDFARFRHPELNEIRGEDTRMLQILKRVVAVDTNCIDVGCHFGSMLSRMTRLAPQGRHVAFEPTPDKVQFLRRKFGDVTIHEIALSDHAGEATFWVNPSASGLNGLKRHGEGPFTQLTVQCARLDDVAPRDRRFGFVKIDVEGAEILVLRGAVEFFERDRPYLLFECGPAGPEAFELESVDLFRQVRELGYEVYTTRGWLESRPAVDEQAFLRALEFPYAAFNWFASPS